MPSFSIIICTYNPEQEIFQRLLNAVLHFDISSPAHEVIIVDNNSSPALVQNKYVQSFLAQKEGASIIVEKKPGLTAGRVGGIERANYDWIIFFDDDNEPAEDYLNIAQKTINQFPEAGAWGPGKVNVDYLCPTDEWLDSKKFLFQQNEELETVFKKEHIWQSCYPYGTGLIIKKQIALEYSKRIKSGRYTLSDRHGKSLSSGGDVQIVLTGIQMGFYAGIISELYLNHLITSSKANVGYLQKQEYGTNSAYIKAFNQVFSNEKIPVQKVTNITVIKKIYSLFRLYYSHSTIKDFKLLVAAKMGELNGRVLASDFSKPWLVKGYEKLINV